MKTVQRFLSAAVIAASLVFAAGQASAQQPAQQAARPNILFLAIDDLRDCVRDLGYEQV